MEMGKREELGSPWCQHLSVHCLQKSNLQWDIHQDEVGKGVETEAALIPDFNSQLYPGQPGDRGQVTQQVLCDSASLSVKWGH